MTRASRVVFEVAAQASDEVVDGARVAVLAQTPDLLQHGLARHHFAFMPQTVRQSFKQLSDAAPLL